MGVNTFVLDRRMTKLSIGGYVHVVGTLRRFFKLTELDERRAAALEAATRITPSPAAAMIMDIVELPLAASPDTPQAAHIVLGWDEGRGHVTDFGWDYLPVLGYAIRDRVSGGYVLYEERDGQLHPIDEHRAVDLGLLRSDKMLARHGQPTINECSAVRRYIPGYAEADCTFDSGQEEKLLVAVESGNLPPQDWFIGKRPMDVRRYGAKPPQPKS